MGARLPRLAAAHPRFAALILGAVAATGFAPLGLWPLTLLCLAALVLLLGRARNLRQALLLGYAFGVGHFTVGLNWIAHAFTYQDAMPHWFGYGAVVLLSFYLAVYPAIATGLAWRLASGRREALILCLAGAWAIGEYLRATMFTGFAWNPVGVLWLGTGVEQAARLIGTYGLGALAILAAGGISLLAGGRYRLAVLFLAPILAIAALGQVEPDQPQGPGPAIRVVQPNIGQGEKYDPAAEGRHFTTLATLSGTPGAAPRLLFWPEAAVDAILDMEPEWRASIAALLGPGDLLMTGGDKYHFRRTTRPFYSAEDLIGANNSLWVVTPDARIAGRYDKAHLVPYGEYLPMRPLLSAIGLSRLAPGDIDFWPGPGPRTLDLPGGPRRQPLKMGVQICYEIIFSGQVVERANRPDFLFNPSNDAWFGSWGPPQHLAQARLRAVEEAMPVIRSTPTGISAVIDTTGTVRAAIGLNRAGFLATSLPPAAPPTPFAKWGNVLPMLLAAILMLSGVAIGRVRR
ncbi:MAG TPA: apolipoprotein N-acyltransferase [Sphingobium sp.]|nr:apolipoprotein N-acyltransferase [Sphingobium sp.]